ncbi:MAG: PAS domain S-box protein [Verrucomicrobiota bacterium]
MRKNQATKSSADSLRQQAEARLATQPMSEPPVRPDDIARVFYELRVHKIELEIQNEQLRRTQTELEVRRALYFDLYDLAPVGYVTLSAQGLILGANLTFASLLGLPRGELVGRILSKFVFEPDVEIYYRHHRQLLATREPQAYEMRMRHAQGTLLWTRVEATVAEDEQGRPVCRIVLSDVSGRKVKEEALRVSEERFRGLFDHMAEGLAICRMLFEDGEPRDFIYLSVNHAFETLTGLHNVVGRKFSEVLPGELESDAQLITIFGRVVQTGRPQKFELFVNTLNMWFSISAYCPEPGCFVAVFDVITERKQTEESLRGNEQRFRSYFDMPLIGVCITSPTTGWLEVNDQLCTMLGYERAELLSTLWPQLTHPDDLAADMDCFNRMLQGEIDQYRLEKRFLHKNGEVIDVDLSVGCVRNSDRTVNFAVALLLDITERKRAATALQSALKQRTSLIKEIHHRVKNNLAIMVSLINMQVRRIKHPDALAALADTKSRLYSMASLHDMLYRSGRMDRVEANGYLELLCNHLLQTYGLSAQGIQIKHRSSAALTLIIDQAVPCGLIINELVSNAMKHAFPNARHGRLKIELLATADCVILRVADNGIGLPDSLKIDQVTSVGLTLVNTLARQLGGTLQIKNKHGTKFEIRFPLRPPTPS